MSKPIKGYRQRMIQEQDDRNSRAKRLKPSQRTRVRMKAKAVFHCRPCGRNVLLSWSSLYSVIGTPKCRTCGGALQIVTACLTKGVLPLAR